MDTKEIHCAHACRTTCAMLVQAVEREQELSDFYQQVAAECNYPEVQSVLADVRILRMRLMEKLENTLSDMRVRGEILDDVQSSFDPAGC